MSETNRESTERWFEERRKCMLRRLGMAGLFICLLAGSALFAQTVTFVRHSEVAAGPVPVSFAIGDFNRDGKPDLVVVDQRSENVKVLLGIGNGCFVPLPNQKFGVGPVAVTTGDFNGDGIPDLVVANRVSNTVELLLGNGDGTFRSFTTLEAFGPTALAVADFNGDGKWISQSRTRIPAVSQYGWAMDTAPSGQPWILSLEPARFSIAVEDFNRDGKPDLAAANLNSENVSILLGTGGGEFQPMRNFAAGQAPAWVALGDFNRDGKLDLAVANSTGVKGVSVPLGNGNGTFQPPLSFSAGANPSFLLAADLNGDGKLDLAVANTGSNSISILLGFGNGFFERPLSFAVGSGPAWIGITDFTADGKRDLIVANSFSDSLSLLSNLAAVNHR